MAKSKEKPIVIHGMFLLKALSSPATTAVKWLVGSFPYSRDEFGRVPVLTAAQAFAVAAAGTYEGFKKRNGRVTHIREIIRESDFPDFAFWEGRACIRYHDDGVMAGHSRKEQNKKMCDVWDHVLQNPPPRWRPRVPVP